MAEKLALNIETGLMVRFKEHAQIENMNIHDFIIEAAERYIAQNEYVGIDDLAEILDNEKLLE